MNIKYALGFIFLAGCAGISRDCNNYVAQNFEANWIVVQLDASGQPINCWQLNNIDTYETTDGIYWQSPNGIYWQSPNGHRVFISGWYERVKVVNNDWEGASKLIGISLPSCKDGHYESTQKKQPEIQKENLSL